MKRQVAILAGGLGTRLRPITEKIPKPLVPVGGQPYLHWQLLELSRQGYRDVLLLVSYLGEQIEEQFGDGAKYNLRIRYSYEKEPMGTGGALKNASLYLNDEFILLNGDSFLRAPFSEMEAAFEAGDFEAMVSTYNNSDPVPVIENIKVEFNAERVGRVLDYKKDAGRAAGFDKIDSGIYLMKRSLVTEFHADHFMLADLWPALIASNRLGAFDVEERFWDIGTPDRLKEFEEKISDYFTHTVSH